MRGEKLSSNQLRLAKRSWDYTADGTFGFAKSENLSSCLGVLRKFVHDIIKHIRFFMQDTTGE